jgi:hypothetical protein
MIPTTCACVHLGACVRAAPQSQTFGSSHRSSGVIFCCYRLYLLLVAVLLSRSDYSALTVACIIALN